MPFNREALEKLVELENCSERQLAQRLNRFIIGNPELAEKYNLKPTISNQSINDWRKIKYGSRVGRNLDLLYLYARSKEYKLEFYQVP